MKADTVGDILRAERERQHMSLNDIARITLIRESYLQAIEESHYSQLPSFIVIRGFIKNYSQVLGLNPAPLIQQLNEEISQTIDQDLCRADKKTSKRIRSLVNKNIEVVDTAVKRNEKRGLTRLEISILVFLGIVVAAFFIWLLYF